MGQAVFEYSFCVIISGSKLARIRVGTQPAESWAAGSGPLLLFTTRLSPGFQWAFLGSRNAQAYRERLEGHCRSRKGMVFYRTSFPLDLCWVRLLGSSLLCDSPTENVVFP